MSNLKNDTPLLSQILKFFIEFVGTLHRKRILFFLPVLLLIWLTITNVTQKRILFPLSEGVAVTINTDATGSEITEFECSDSLLRFSYILQPGEQYPYAGIRFEFSDSLFSTHYNLGNFDYIDFVMQVSPQKRKLTFYVSTIVEDLTSPDSSMSWRVNNTEFAIDTVLQTYRIPRVAFVTPTWWFEKNKLHSDDILKTDWNKCLNLVIENNPYEETFVEVDVIIRSTTSGRNLTFFNRLLVGGIALYYLLYLLAVAFGKEYLGGGTVIIPYKPLDINNYADDDALKIEHYAAENYSDAELTVKQVSSDTGIAQIKIQAILKTQFHMTFRRYLNQIRIHEAKRLLRETDRQVTDIAYRIGYRNVTHFNRIFKEMADMSPNQYRKKNTTQQMR